MNSFFTSQFHTPGQLTLYHRIERDNCLTLVDIPQVAHIFKNNNELLSHWLSPEERLYLHQLRFAKRYNEWLSGRIAAKWGLSKQCGESFQPAVHTILPDEHGCPQLRPTRPGRHISISHSHQFCTALTTDTPCGIDIQKINRQILRVKKRVAAKIEIDMTELAIIDDEKAAMTLIWTVKEAVKKNCLSTRPGLFEAINIQSIRKTGQQTNRWLANCLIPDTNHSQDVNIIRLDKYMLAWSTVTKNKN